MDVERSVGREVLEFEPQVGLGVLLGKVPVLTVNVAAKLGHDKEAVAQALNDPAVKEAMAKQGNTINVSTSEFAQNYFRTEKDKYAALVKKAGIELQ